MRLSEKTIEVNFCSQMASAINPSLWWFGLTQKQEADAGWDVAAKLQGRWVMFQIKASKNVLRSGLRQFQAPHHQLLELKHRARTPGKVFYVLPTIGTTRELTSARFHLLPNLRFLDVIDIPASLGPPTVSSGALRKNEKHYLDLDAINDLVTIHSDPVEVPVLDVNRAIGRMVEIYREPGTSSDSEVAGARGRLSEAREFIESGRNRVAAFMPT